MFKDLMHSLLGSSAGQIAAGHPLMSNTAATQVAPKSATRSTSKKLFHGSVEVLQVANGYVVHIARKEGYEYETYIADTITDVNERIAAAIVAFQLES